MLCSALLCYDTLRSPPQARGLHRDIKPGNILLDEKLFRAKLADLGLAKLIRDEITISTNITGSRPYLDPGYVADGRYLRESDVYSFGITLLEILTGALGGFALLWSVLLAALLPVLLPMFCPMLLLLLFPLSSSRTVLLKPRVYEWLQACLA